MGRGRTFIAALAAGTTLAGAAGVTALATVGGTADHRDAPMIAGDPRVDINDVYVFPAPDAPASTVLVMTVNPLAGLESPTDFDDAADYQFYVDTDGDARNDRVYSLSFRSTASGQRVQIGGPGLKPGSVDRGAVGDTISLSNGGKLTTGVFDDPFFFDLAGFSNGLQFTGDNFFAGLNVSAIVLQLPNSELGGDGADIGVHAGTRRGSTQVDRMGRPAINTVLIPSSLKDEFNRVAPHRQPDRFGDIVRGNIAQLNGGDTALATTLTDVLLPDILTFEVGNTAGFLNGRALADDVIDAELNLLTKGAVTGDGVANDSAFRTSFPYLAPAN
jgi:hypothetical protein